MCVLNVKKCFVRDADIGQHKDVCFQMDVNTTEVTVLIPPKAKAMGILSTFI